jgi:hypothetical protein
MVQYFFTPFRETKHSPSGSRTVRERGLAVNTLTHSVEVLAVCQMSKHVRPVSMASVIAQFPKLKRHHNSNETIHETTPTMQCFTLMFPRLRKAFNCCSLLGSYAAYESCSHKNNSGR